MLDLKAPATTQVTPKNIEAYMADLKDRVNSVTAWNCIYKVRRAAQLMAPGEDFSWLREIENDLAFVMEPKSKIDRVVFAQKCEHEAVSDLPRPDEIGACELLCFFN